MNPDGTVKSRAFYDANGRQFNRQDFDHPHFDKILNSIINRMSIVRDVDRNMRIRIDPSDKITNYPHVHVYDSNGNLLDVAGNIVDRKSPDGHIPYKDN